MKRALVDAVPRADDRRRLAREKLRRSLLVDVLRTMDALEDRARRRRLAARAPRETERARPVIDRAPAHAEARGDGRRAVPGGIHLHRAAPVLLGVEQAAKFGVEAGFVCHATSVRQNRASRIGGVDFRTSPCAATGGVWDCGGGNPRISRPRKRCLR